MMDMYDDLLYNDKSLLKTSVIKRKDKSKRNKDVFLNYGTGIKNYFIVQERIILLFCYLTILAIPQMLIYRYFDGYNYTQDNTVYTKLSFGSMGFSSSNCGTNFVNWDTYSTQVSL
jgi:hypothetical protein